MSYKPFEVSAINLFNNPFSNTKSTPLVQGVYIKGVDIENQKYTPLDREPIYVGLLTKFKEKIEKISLVTKPHHIVIWADYGEGKSFSFRIIQDEILRRYVSPIISVTLSNDELINYRNNIAEFKNNIRKSLDIAFNKLPLEKSKKEEVYKKYKLDKAKSFSQFLQSIDKAFKELGINVYIFIDEIDKIVNDQTFKDEHIREFLNYIKAICEECSDSISLLLAGSPSCKAKMQVLGKDYLDRVESIDSNRLTIKETQRYISEKSKSSIKYYGLMPFTRSTIEIIFNITLGNIRQIEIWMHNLWDYAADKKIKITKTVFGDFIKSNVRSAVIQIYGNQIPESVIELITDTFINSILKNNDSKSKRSILNNKSIKSKKEIQSFLDANKSLFVEHNQTLVFSTIERDKILNVIRGQ